MLFVTFLSLLILFLGSAYLQALPSYITACSLSDPEFEKCALASGHNFFKHLQENGDKNLNIDSIKVISFPIVHLKDTKGNISINVTDAFILGVEHTVIRSIKKDPTKNRIQVNVIFPQSSLSGNYNITAKIGDVTVAGDGPGVWLFDNFTYDISFEWDVIERNGIKYTHVIKTDVEYDLDFSYIHVQQLFAPGSNLDEVFNDNWQYVARELSLTVKDVGKALFFLLSNTLFNTVPYNELFLE